jgi:hypothetical protein
MGDLTTTGLPSSEYLIAWNNLLNVTQTLILTWLAYRFGRKPPR